MKYVTINNNSRKAIIKAIAHSLKTGEVFYTNGTKIKPYTTTMAGYYNVTELLSKTPEAHQAHYLWINNNLPTVAKIYEWNKGTVRPIRTIQNAKMMAALEEAGMADMVQYIK